MALTSGAVVSIPALESQDDIMNIRRDISQNVIKCNKRS